MANPNPSPSTRFRPGDSGNPRGRPRRKLVSEALAKELARRIAAGEPTQAQEAAAVLVGLMLKGDVPAAKLVLSYVEGLPSQPVEHSGPDGQELVFTLTLDRPSGMGADDGDR